MTISGRAQLAGVIGWPVSHSRSPLLHNHWISTLGLEAAYVPLAVKPENIASAIRALPKLGFKGANVTVPHKEAAMAHCDRLDEAAKRIGAVNTLIVNEDGTIEGRNTDAIGFSESLKAQAGTDGLKGATALVLGAGGASRAIITALMDLGFASIRLANRSRRKADVLVAAFAGGKTAIEAVDWDKRDDALDGVTLLVNTTSLGMKGQPALEIDLSPLAANAIIADIVYVPLETPLIVMARELGFATVTGLRMLVEQARPGFEAWFGKEPPVTPELMEMLETDVKAAG